MKVFISIKYHADRSNQLRLETLRELARKHGMEPVCIADEATLGELKEFDPHELMRKTFLELRDSKLVIVDLTEKGVGVGIEAGYARARGIPIVTLAAAGSEVSESLAGISDRIFFYENWEAMDRIMAEMEKVFVPINQPRPLARQKRSHHE